MIISRSRLYRFIATLTFVLLVLLLVQQLTRLYWSTQRQITKPSLTEIRELKPLSALTIQSETKANSEIKELTKNLKPATGIWILQGVYHELDEPNESLAMISVNGDIGTYSPGDSLVDDVVITEITPNSVTVNNRGERQSLYMSKNTLELVDQVIENTSVINTNVATESKTAPSSQSTASSAVPDNASSISSQDIIKMINRNPMVLLEYLSLEPVSVRNDRGEPVTGYQLNAPSPNILASVGLEDKDILITINDLVVSPNNLSPLLDEIKKGKKINAKIYRDGRIMLITLNL